jgi:hypothetical protein
VFCIVSISAVQREEIGGFHTNDPLLEQEISGTRNQLSKFQTSAAVHLFVTPPFTLNYAYYFVFTERTSILIRL